MSKTVEIEGIKVPDAFTYVYVLTDGFAIKVGIANDVKKRIRGVQTGNPRKVSCIGLIPCESRTIATNVEWEWHNRSKMRSYLGEWFNAEDFAYIVDSKKALSSGMRLDQLCLKDNFKKYLSVSDEITQAYIDSYRQTSEYYHEQYTTVSNQFLALKDAFYKVADENKKLSEAYKQMETIQFMAKKIAELEILRI